MSVRTVIEASLKKLLGRKFFRPICSESFKWQHRLGRALSDSLYSTGNKAEYALKSANSKFGMIYKKVGAVFSFGVFRRPSDKKICFIIERPTNIKAAANIARLIKSRFATTDIYIRHLDKAQQSELLKCGFENVDAANKPFVQTAPQEDEEYPEVLVDITKTVFVSGNMRSKLARAERALEGSYYELRPLTDRYSARRLVEAFFKVVGENNGSSADDYYALIDAAILLRREKGIFAYMAFVDDIPVGLYIAEEYSKGKALLLANISLKQPKYLPVYGHMALFKKLGREGISTVNLGGSETLRLHNTKLSLAALTDEESFMHARHEAKRAEAQIKQNKTYWVCLAERKRISREISV